MDLIFEDAANRRPCEFEVTVNEMLMPCMFSSSKTVTIPKGLSFTSGKFESSENEPASTISICKNHELRLRHAFDELMKD